MSNEYPTPEGERERASEQFLSAVHLEANGANQALQESWERPVRHNRNWERLALFHTVRLVDLCEQGQRQPWRLVSGALSAAEHSAEARYEIEAAIGVLPRVTPYDFGERMRLGASAHRMADSWDGSVGEREPELVERWHQWLWGEWIGPAGQPQGDPALLLTACSRLNTSVPVALGW